MCVLVNTAWRKYQEQSVAFPSTFVFCPNTYIFYNELALFALGSGGESWQALVRIFNRQIELLYPNPL